MEHTHLVKGLDFALLQKVRAEIEKEFPDLEDEGEEGDETAPKEKRKSLGDQVAEDEATKGSDEEEAADDKVKFKFKPKILSKSDTAAIAASLSKAQGVPKLEHKKKDDVFKSPAAKTGGAVEEDESKLTFKTKMGRSVYRVLFESQLPKVNELFMPHRMAYIVDLVDDDADVPITSIRSKVECPNNESLASMTTNDIVINKLTQILSYLRHSKKDAKKGKKKGDEKEDEPVVETRSQFHQSKDDLG